MAKVNDWEFDSFKCAVMTRTGQLSEQIKALSDKIEELTADLHETKAFNNMIDGTQSNKKFDPEYANVVGSELSHTVRRRLMEYLGGDSADVKYDMYIGKNTIDYVLRVSIER